MNKIKHNKYKNTGILFELLIRQIASDTVSGKDSPAVNIIKKYFNKSELSKEYKLYQTLANAKILSESKAEVLITTVIDLSSKLNKSNLRKEKYNLIKEIKEHYDLEEFFKAKINNYKTYASIYNLIEAKSLEDFTEPSQIIDNKIFLLEHITRKQVNKEDVKDRVLEEYMKMDKGTRILTYRILLEKFNKKYDTLANNQKIILKEFINNISNTTKLRSFVNERYNIIKSDLKTLSNKVDEPTTKVKLEEIISLIKPFEKGANVKDEDIITLLQYSQLVNELKEIHP